MRRLLPALVAAGCAVAALAVTAPASQAAVKQLKGTVTWSSTTTFERGDDPQSITTGTEKVQVTLKVKLTRRAGAYGWQVENGGSSFTGSYSLDRRTEERDIDGNLTCIRTSVGTGKGGGAIPKSGTPSLSSNIIGGPRTGPGGTLVLSTNLRYEGEQTHTDAGQGISPCQSGTDVDPIEGSLAAGNDARRVCFPSGAKKNAQVAGNVIGAWKASKRSYSFSCTNRWSEPQNARSYLQTFTGSLKAS